MAHLTSVYVKTYSTQWGPIASSSEEVEIMINWLNQQTGLNISREAISPGVYVIEDWRKQKAGIEIAVTGTTQADLSQVIVKLADDRKGNRQEVTLIGPILKNLIFKPTAKVHQSFIDRGYNPEV